MTQMTFVGSPPFYGDEVSYIYIITFICVYACVHVYTYIYIYIHTHIPFTAMG